MLTFEQRRAAAASIREESSTRLQEIEDQRNAVMKAAMDKATEFGWGDDDMKVLSDYLTDAMADVRFDQQRMLEYDIEHSDHVATQTYADYSRDFWESPA
jgi:hypothetical protein